MVDEMIIVYACKVKRFKRYYFLNIRTLYLFSEH